MRDATEAYLARRFLLARGWKDRPVLPISPPFSTWLRALAHERHPDHPRHAPTGSPRLLRQYVDPDAEPGPLCGDGLRFRQCLSRLLPVYARPPRPLHRALRVPVARLGAAGGGRAK